MIISGINTGRLVRRHISTIADGRTIMDGHMITVGMATDIILDPVATIEADGAIAEDIEAKTVAFNRFECGFYRM